MRWSGPSTMASPEDGTCTAPRTIGPDSPEPEDGRDEERPVHRPVADEALRRLPAAHKLAGRKR